MEPCKDLQQGAYTSNTEIPRNPHVLSSKTKTDEPSSQLARLGRHPNAPLENLPPELRGIILSMMNLKDLKSLVHASPAYHRHYRDDTNHVLWGSIRVTFGPSYLLPDVLATHESGSKAFWETRCKDTVDDFLRQYQNKRLASYVSSSSEGSTLQREFPLDETLRLVRFYFSVANNLTPLFTRWALSNLTAEAPIIQDMDIPHQPLTETEEIRILRAFYRFQLLCNVFAHGYDTHFIINIPAYRPLEVQRWLDELFTPWEVEEIACVHEFVLVSYLESIQTNWTSYESLAQQGFIVRDEEELGESSGANRANTYLFGTVSCGLKPLHDGLFKEPKRVPLVLQIAEEQSNSMRGARFLGDFFSWLMNLRRLPLPSAQNAPAGAQAGHPFQGDAVIDPEGVYPPIGWTLNWRRYHCEVLAWGYVMWDETRMAEKGLPQVLDP
ncbi:hypothetical protein N7457_000623 [Penicillium paradoxum]|uniref:uncharacterized protein n=1 Tax=Penicillium paradoxum TaxID=176176 RepID=UPI002549BF0B|nr:uncharacterized protein N7457_000623 [Penicillium paradoxum]KAJ5794024.1 hypothetical protein N7457_000623 [Penicillium paradoxum]